MNAQRAFAKLIAKDWYLANGAEVGDLTGSWIVDVGYADDLAEKASEEVTKLAKRMEAKLDSVEVDLYEPNPVVVVQKFLDGLGVVGYGVKEYPGNHEGFLEVEVTGLPKFFDTLMFRAIVDKYDLYQSFYFENGEGSVLINFQK